MPERGVAHPALDMGGDRERRVHQHDGRAHRCIEPIVDLRGVVPRHADAREQRAQNIATRLRQLIQSERRARKFREYRDEAGSRRRLQHEIGGNKTRGDAGDKAKSDRRRELLQGLALFRTTALGRQESGNLSQHGDEIGGRLGARPHRRAVFTQKQDGRGLAGVIGVLPRPSALGVGSS